jgi:hypothetical protein
LIGIGPAVACSLVVIPVASCSRISIDAELQFDNSTVDDAYYYLPLLLTIIEV